LNQQTFGEVLPGLIRERGLSQRELATRIAVDPTFLSKAVRASGGKRPSISLIERVARALDLDPEFFVEVRVARIATAAESDPALRERLYREVLKSAR
jgi:transcriptional regulator with XRE-family HTH domain